MNSRGDTGRLQSMRREFVLATALAVLLSCLNILPPRVCRAGIEGPRTAIVLGSSDPFPPRAESRTLPMARYLASRLGEQGIRRGEVLIPADPRGMIDLLKGGEVDLVFTTSFPAAVYRREAGARVLLQAERQGVRRHYCRIFVRKDSGITDLEGLRGRVIAFRSLSSTAGYFLPFCVLQAEGLGLVPVEPGSVPPADKVGYVFADDELNISTWVYMGKVDAGVLRGELWEVQKANPEAYRRDFTVLHDTADLPGLVISAAPHLEKELSARVSDILLTMHEDPAGVEALEAAGITRFSRPQEDLLQPVEDLLKIFERGR